jgi:prophage antirepressor-like protein
MTTDPQRLIFRAKNETIFHSEENERLCVHLTEDGDPWFSALDVSRILALRYPLNCVKSLKKDQVHDLSGGDFIPFHKTTEGRFYDLKTPNCVESYLISESGVYCLALLAPYYDKAVNFIKWVAEDIMRENRLVKREKDLAKELSPCNQADTDPPSHLETPLVPADETEEEYERYLEELENQPETLVQGSKEFLEAVSNVPVPPEALEALEKAPEAFETPSESRHEWDFPIDVQDDKPKNIDDWLTKEGQTFFDAFPFFLEERQENKPAVKKSDKKRFLNVSINQKA